ncbi:MAG: hypothetical protein NXH85_17600 [Pseudomonadaceae bacterium]|nr:hypothetical protein [Pseudomonadaceae bacterium]
MFRALLIHSAESQRLAFADEIEPYLGELTCEHHVEPLWLARARDAGSEDPGLRSDVARWLSQQAGKVDMIMCTCSTLGPLFDELGESHSDVATARADRAMMQRAAQQHRDIALAYCLDSTAQPSASLLRASMAAVGHPGAIIEIQCERAWPLFEAGDQEAYAGSITQSIVAALEPSPDIGCIVLAQGSMSVASAPLSARLDTPVLSAPGIAVEWLAQVARAQSD